MFGTMRLPVTNPDDNGSIDIPEFSCMADYFIANGGTYFDTAWMYHECKSEAAVGTAVTGRHARNEFTVTTKLPSFMIKSPEDRDFVFQKQLENTAAGYFDVYLIHAVQEANIETFEKNDCFSWLLEKKKQGIVKKCGFSFHGTPALLDRLLTDYPWVEVVQLQLNYLDWEDPVVQSRACYEIVKKHGKQVIVMEPVKGGRLARLPKQAEAELRKVHPDWTPASWALRFAAGLENVWMVLSGMTAMEQMEENVALFKDIAPLNGEELAALERVRKVIFELTAIHCTGCSYCMAKCPQKIRIPSLFSLYNNDCMEETEAGHATCRLRYRNQTKTVSPADCLKCGACEDICPQHLPVRELLETVSAHFASARD